MNSSYSLDAKRYTFTSRLYRDERDLSRMLDLLMEARSHTDKQGHVNDWHYCHIGDLVWKFFMVQCRANPREHVRLWHDDGGKLAGYAVLGGDDVSVDWQVLPEYEWHGIEDEAMAWTDARLAELVQHDPKTWGGNFAARAPRNDVRRISFLEGHGFTLGEYSELNLLRSLDDPILNLTLPAGCLVRAVAGAEDTSNRAAAERDVWYPYTVGNVSDEDYARFMRLPGYERDLDIVTVAADGVIAAYAMTWVDPVNRIGDFGPVGARPAYRRRGLTRAALLEGLRRMRQRGMNRACVSTGTRNAAARALYESIGFSVVNETLEYVKGRALAPR